MSDNNPNPNTNPDLMRQLTAADPVDLNTVPGPDAPAAQQLLEATIAAPAVTAPAGDTAPRGDTAADITAPVVAATSTATTDPVVEHLAPRRSSLGRSRAALVSVAAAVLLLVGGLAVFAPENTPSALAAVHSAAAAADDADTGRITTTFTVDGSFEEDGQTASEMHTATFEAEYSGSDIAFSLTSSESDSDAGFDAGDLPFTEGRLVDDVLYFNSAGRWLGVDTDGFLGSIVSDFVDPRVVLEKVQELTEATEVGEVTIDGQTVTHYQSVVDLGDESLSQSGWLGFEAGDLDGEGEVTVDLYVGSDDILSRLDLSGDVQEGADSGTFEVSMRFTDIGSDIEVEAPAGAVNFDPLGDFLDE
jgi:hypothetical protein